jgi:hypothetical protein
MPVFVSPVVRRRYVAYFDGLGILTFRASADHASVTSYAIRLYTMGTTSPLLASRDIGKPTPDTNNDIIHDINGLLSPLANGNYTVTVLATSPGGSAETTGTNFSMPLS